MIPIYCKIINIYYSNIQYWIIFYSKKWLGYHLESYSNMQVSLNSKIWKRVISK